MKDNVNKHNSIFIKIDNFKKVANKGFIRGTVRIAYAGDNRNNSHITKKAFKKAEKTLFGVPIVGNWLGDNFGGHDVIMETRGNELILKDNTSPIGFVPDDANPRWEEVKDDYGNIKQYYTCDVILWKDRFPEEVEFIINNGANQSMEIFVEDGDYDMDTDKYKIYDFYYSALCILGKDEENIENNVEPCFEDSAITIEFSKKFNNSFKEMLREFSGMKVQKGGIKMDKDLELKIAKLEKEKEELTSTLNDLTKSNKELEDTYKQLEDKYNKTQEDLKVLQDYKNKVEEEKFENDIEELKDKYSMLLSKEVIDSCYEEGISVGDFELNLSLAYANSQLEKLKKNKKDKFTLTDFNRDKSDDSDLKII